MNITVYCGANAGTSEKTQQITRELGSWIGEQGHTLVFGGGTTGLMGLVAESAHDAGAEVVGVIPEFMTEFEPPSPAVDDLVVVDGMPERKRQFRKRADVFVVLPGGLGTLEECSEALATAKVEHMRKRKYKPCVFFNIDGFYEPLKDLFHNMSEGGFFIEESYDDLHFVDSVDEFSQLMERFSAESAGA